MTARNGAPSESAGGPDYGRIFKSTFVIGSASIFNVLNGVLRMKVAAMLLGPAGIGLLGLVGAIIGAAGTVVQLGMGTVGTRQIAEAHASGDAMRVATSRRALFLATVGLALLGASIIWLIRSPLAEWTLGNIENRSSMMFAVAISVALSVAGTAQGALLQGMRRMKDLAASSIIGATASTIVGLPLLWIFGTAAIPAFVIVPPFVGFVVGLVMVARIPRPHAPPFAFAAMIPHWAMFVRLGIPFMAASMSLTGAELLIRIDVRDQLGLTMLGQFQASWTIAAQYVGFVLGAMAADYYPRLTGTLARPREAVALVNQQSEIALLLAGCAVLAMFGWAPEIVSLLYSPDFIGAADVLRWQTSATMLKILSWPLGFILLAAGAGTTFLLTEVATLGLMVVSVHFLLPAVGLKGAGIAYFISYVFYLPLIYWVAGRRINFRWSRPVLEIAGALSVLLASLIIIQLLAPNWTAVATFGAVASYGAFALLRLCRAGMTETISGRANQLLPQRLKSRIGWILKPN